jgi:hypothetical protein
MIGTNLLSLGSVVDPHYFDADPDWHQGDILMRIRIRMQILIFIDADPDFYLMRIRIRLFTLMWIRIQILAFKKGSNA